MYGYDIERLASQVSPYLAEGLNAGDSVIVVAVPEHVSAFRENLRRLIPDIAGLELAGRFCCLDAHETLRTFICEDIANWRAFDDSVGDTVRQFHARAPNGRVRAYGEMVGLLWQDGLFSVAMALETVWERVIASTRTDLYCAYPIDVFGDAFYTCDVDALHLTHHRVRPFDSSGRLETALKSAMNEVLGSHAADVWLAFERDAHPAWASELPSEALILWLRENLCDAGDAIVQRAKQIYPAKPSDAETHSVR